MTTEATLRQRREAIGLTLREVARRAQMNPGRLSIIERGVTPTPDELRRITAAMQGKAL